jgi:hypothetical protein
VTRRQAYEESGGFRPELGHFAEWALAASYFERGHKIGYLPEALVHHYYTGSLAELKAFTLDFVKGEASYFSEDLREPGNNLLEIPSELVCRGNFDRGMAQAILGMIGRDILTSDGADGRRKQNLFTLLRWASPAIFGDGLARSKAAAARFHAYLVVKLGPMVGSRERLGARFRRYIAALIRYQRLKCIRAERLNGAAGVSNTATASGVNALVLDRTGFYPLEKYQGSQFRWSETAAAIRLRAGAGRQSIRITCAPVRKLSDAIDVRFYFDGKRIPDHAISAGADDFEIHIDLPRSGACKLGWICRPFEATADPRRLGLPVTGVELTSWTGHALATDLNLRVASNMKSA